ncbi:MAG: flavin reductase [Acidimicrobiia bacterium]|jgi:flavin reductase (DIM6/NTAB) family NADH-FMN oxidoreductase RutF|nr:flavin reductase [Acidimicrobiia bacterium]
MTADPFDAIMGSLDVPLAVVTTAKGDERAGCLIGFHAQSSIDPGRYCVWISKANHTYRLMLRSTHLAVHYLTSDDREIARLFGTLSGDDVDKFTLCEAEAGAHGVPVLVGCPNRIVVRRVALLDEGGDHVCVVTEPVETRSAGPFTPLRLSDVSDLVPGHQTGERPDPPTERAGATRPDG